MAVSAYKLWMYMATGFLSKINFLFAITKIQGQGIEVVLEKTGFFQQDTMKLPNTSDWINSVSSYSRKPEQLQAPHKKQERALQHLTPAPPALEEPAVLSSLWEGQTEQSFGITNNG